MKPFIISTLISVFSLVFALIVAANMPELDETFRGCSIPATISPEKFADELVLSIELMRRGGVEPKKYNFQVPDGWQPPAEWQPPEGWQPPEWFPK